LTKLLITGEMRSGTTFLANFLNSQNDMYVHADMLISLFMEGQALKIKNIDEQLTDKQKNILFSNFIQQGKIHDLDFSGINRKKTNSWWEIFNEAMYVMQTHHPASLIGIKRTNEEKYLRQLLDKGVKVIYCYRDPRDVLYSASNRFSGFNSFKSADNLKKNIKFALTLKNKPGFFFLKYEDLILEKEKTAAALSQFVSMPVHTELTELKFGLSKKYQDNSSFGDVKKLFDETAVYRWKNNTDAKEVLLADVLLKHEIEELGYEKSYALNKKKSKEILKQYQSYSIKTKLKNFVKSKFSKLIS